MTHLDPVDAQINSTIPQLAAEWQCSEDTVRRLIARGELKAIRVGRLIRIPRAAIKRAERPVTRIGGGA